MKKGKLDYKVTAVILFVASVFWLADAALARQVLSGAVGVACLAAAAVNVLYCRKCGREQEDKKDQK
ncbi:MAG: hypothetical protein LKJ80_02785 [Oscillibacter sp.]|jgi:uncharacterized membrane protein HdeD (DUF308 family)|nr:hypothetical protein [Oscillibacter sp.]